MKKIIIFAIILISPTCILFAEGRSGEQVYKAFCATCHATGVANAPKLHDEAAWNNRGKSLLEFLESSKQGINAMPPMGICMDCTDNELKDTIEYMMSAEPKDLSEK